MPVASAHPRFGIASAMLLILLCVCGCRSRSADAPSTRPAASQRAESARIVYEALVRRLDEGEQVTPGYVELRCQWSRRWCLAELARAHERDERRAAIDEHVERLSRFGEALGMARRERPTRAQFAHVNYFIEEAREWKASEREGSEESTRRFRAPRGRGGQTGPP